MNRARHHQLVAKVLVPAHVQDGDAKRPLSAGLGVRLRKATIGMFFYIFHWNQNLFDVAEPRDELLAGDRLAILVLVPLTYQPGTICWKLIPSTWNENTCQKKYVETWVHWWEGLHRWWFQLRCTPRCMISMNNVVVVKNNDIKRYVFGQSPGNCNKVQHELIVVTTLTMSSFSL